MMSLTRKLRWDGGPLRWALRGTGRLASAAEAVLFGSGPPKLPPLFIVGWPRAGTTLVYQSVCHTFEVSFPTRACDQLPIAGAVSTRVTQKRGNDFRSNFQSSYGFSDNWYAPGEGIVWNQWFDKDKRYDSADALRPHARLAIQRFVGQIERMNGTPFVNKNLRHDHRIGALSELFPNALFLVVFRNPEATAASLLRARVEMAGDEKKWFSIQPRCYEDLRGLPVDSQIAGQLKGLFEDLVSDIRRVGTDRFVAVDYDEYCQDSGKCLNHLRRFYLRHGVALRTRNAAPESFPPSKREVGSTNAIVARDLANRIAEEFSDRWPPDLPCAWLGTDTFCD